MLRVCSRRHQLVSISTSRSTAALFFGMTTTLASLHHAWLPRPVPLFPRQRESGNTASPEDVLAMLPALKLAARLMHALQTERGVTCGWIASQGSAFVASLSDCRAATDIAVSYTHLTLPTILLV